MKKIIVIGSSNTDMVIKTKCLPQPGETVIGGEYFMNSGGKGANQAVAVKRLGGNLVFATKLGDDLLGRQYIEKLSQEGIYDKFIFIDQEHASGVAQINVDEKGENSIVVAPGANMAITKYDIDMVAEVMEEGDYLLMQLEIPVDCVEYAAKIAFEKGVKVILNPAPARELPKSIMKYLYMITPNCIEAKMLAGITASDDINLELLADKLSKMGVENVLITLGSKGSFIKEVNQAYNVDAFKVVPVDTTAAGDTFNGALCVGLTEGMSIKEAAVFASKASSISVTRNGAQNSIPFRKEIQ